MIEFCFDEFLLASEKSFVLLNAPVNEEKKSQIIPHKRLENHFAIVNVHRLLNKVISKMSLLILMLLIGAF